MNTFQINYGQPQQQRKKTSKHKWTPAEDNNLKESVGKNGTKNWFLIASEMPGRNCKQCRERWVNILDPKLNSQNWEPHEDLLLLKNHIYYGNAWAKIAQHLPGRSPNGVKNRYYLLTRNKISIPSTIEMLEKEELNFLKTKEKQVQNESKNINDSTLFSENEIGIDWKLSDD